MHFQKNFIKNKTKLFLGTWGGPSIIIRYLMDGTAVVFWIHFGYISPISVLYFNTYSFSIGLPIFSNLFFPIPRLLKVINLEYSVKEKESQLSLVLLMRPF